MRPRRCLPGLHRPLWPRIEMPLLLVFLIFVLVFLPALLDPPLGR